ncbi:Aromatic/aminoadipate aminotransferase 1 [Vermiconidia calcicola]|uniref:Aromatic/aminoadipate aminotransferase 1 n=1 Tax=Vermiconidia calcicola TaxID=1690605 RepID=A0ACC3NN49_9PEZI|nr:Aromatic/aminoadipate aminotransferase 1 [Vermiconidia calcicola]
MAPPAAIEVLAETDTSTFTIPDRLTLQSVAKRRAASGKVNAGVAAAADVEAFKGATQHLHKPKAKRWDHRLTTEAKARKASSLKNAARLLKTPGLISLGGGLPSSEYFPFDEVSIKVPQNGQFSEKATHEHGKVVTAGKHDLAEDKSLFDVATAFQYGQGTGSAQLLRWMIEHTELVHDPPYQDWSSTMTVGSTSATDMAFRMFCKPGDWIMTEQFTFPSMVETVRPMGVQVAGIPMDEYGMRADALDELLSNWNEAERRGPKPFVLYIVPTGQNPTGATQPEQRRRDIYAIAQKHDLYILEDEPYYFLQMQPYTGPNSPDAPPPASHEDFLKSLVPSYLSMDVDGRVMRFDSFSKVIAPGSRLGWITASEQICDRYRTHADFSTQGASGMSQLILFKLLEDHWGHEGYLDWLIHIRMEYTARRNTILGACERYLPKDIVSWVPPMAGMFHWLQIDYTKHPAYVAREKTMDEIEEEIFLKNVERGTLLMKGSWFCGEEGVERDVMFFRATYAAAPFEKIDEAIRRFAGSVREVFGLEQLSNGSH